MRYGMNSLVLVAVLFVSCGRTEPTQVKIVGGTQVSEHYPWFAQLMMSSSSSKGFCGGTLIAPRVVLTAAHCIVEQKIDSLYVALGMADGRSLHLKNPVKVLGAVIHPQYTPVAGRNDIGLLYLADYSSQHFERPVEAISIDRSENQDFTTPLRAVGLGEMTSLGSVRNGLIYEVDLPIINRSICSSKYDVNDSQICAGNWDSGGVDTCQGDSGGPLVIKNAKNIWNLVGVVSFGDGCAQKGAPGVYVRAAYFTNWINETAAKLSRPVTDEPLNVVLAQLIPTKCLYQFNHLEIENRVGDVNFQRTTFGISATNFDLILTPTLPDGQQLQYCEWKYGAKNIKVRWFKDVAGMQPNKIIVAAEAFDSSLSKTEFLISGPKSLSYRQDVLNCETSKGPVVLVDKRDQTLVSIDSVFYKLGKTVRGPLDNQTTWGCSIGDSSVEMYEVTTSSGIELAARIHHRSVGTVSVGLVRNDKSSDVYANIAWSTDTKGKLTVQNRSNVDLYTWSIACAKPFKLKLGSGQEIQSETEIDSQRHAVSVESATMSEGVVKMQQDVALDFEVLTAVPFVELECRINRMLNVEKFASGQ